MGLFDFGKKKDQSKKAPAAVKTAKKGSISSVKVLGAGCKNCHKQFENAKQAVKDMGLSVEVEYITDMPKVMEYGVMKMPAIVVNEKVVSQGRVLKAEGVQALLQKVGS